MLRLALPALLAFAVSAPLHAQPRTVGPGGQCGGIAAIQCRKGLWCEPQPWLCRGADISGTCVEVPDVCTREYRPVCGCDGRTYGNDCERRAARITKNHNGACQK